CACGVEHFVYQVKAMLIELAVGHVSGFDLSALDTYRGFTSAGRVDLAALPHRQLSAVRTVHDLDLQARVATVQATHAKHKQEGHPGDESASCDDVEAQGWELDIYLEFEVTGNGRWNAVAFWMELGMGEGT